jgi:O-antigen/teichoic acid export membrane protein
MKSVLTVKNLPSSGIGEALVEATAIAVTLAWSSLASVVIAGVGSLVVARILGPEGYGVYSLVLAVPSFLAAISDLGLPTALVRYPSKYSDRAGLYIPSGLILLASSASLASLACFLFREPLARYIINRPEYSELIAITAPFVLSYLLLSALRSSLLGVGRRGRAALVDPLYNTLRVVLSMALASIYYVRGAIVGFVVASIISSAVSLVLLITSTTGLSLKVSRELLIDMLKFSLPLYATSILASLLGTYSTIVMSRAFSDAEIGNYRAAANLLSVISVAIAPFSTAFLRVFSEARDGVELARDFAESVKYVPLFSIPLTVFSSTCSADIVRVVYGRRYAEAPEYFRVLVLAYALTLIGSHSLGSALNALGETRYILISNVVGALVYLPLLYLLASRVGLVGVAIASVVLSTVTTATQLCLLSRRIPVRFEAVRQTRLLLASVAASVPLVPIATSATEFLESLAVLLAKFVVYLAVYLLLAVVLGVVGVREVVVLKTLARGLGVFGKFLSPVLWYLDSLIKLLMRFRRS